MSYVKIKLNIQFKWQSCSLNPLFSEVSPPLSTWEGILVTFLTLGLQWMTRQRQPHREDRGRASFQSHPKQPVVSTQLALNKNRVCQPGCPAADPRSENISGKLGSFKLFICLHFSSFAIDLQEPFPRAPLVSAWQGSWLFSSLIPGLLPISCETAQHQLPAQRPLSLAPLQPELSDPRVFVSPVSSPAPPDNAKLGSSRASRSDPKSPCPPLSYLSLPPLQALSFPPCPRRSISKVCIPQVPLFALSQLASGTWRY